MSLQLSPELLAYAYTLGIFALLSPCGYALLPGYASHWMSSKASPERALAGGVISTLGFITTFLLLGLLLSVIGAVLIQFISWIEIIAAGVVLVFGIFLLFEVPLPSLRVNPSMIWRQDYLGMYGFGLTYGLAATGCSAPIFFSMVALALTQGVWVGTSMLMLYGIGMGSAFIATAVLVAEARQKVVKRVSRITPILHKLTAMSLIGAGAYLLSFYLRALLL